jgi:hypothetical protein
MFLFNRAPWSAFRAGARRIAPASRWETLPMTSRRAVSAMAESQQKVLSYNTSIVRLGY